jgi:flagellar protein FliT
MDAAESVWRHVMSGAQPLLTKLLLLTEEIIQQANAIHPSMKENAQEQLERVQSLVDQREAAIKELDALLKLRRDENGGPQGLRQNEVGQQMGHPQNEAGKPQAPRWNEDEHQQIKTLQTLERTLQIKMGSLHQSFSKQMHRIHETKSMSKKYIAAYQTIATDGSFIDKRK